jgi:cytoskeletal protein RodZ
MIVSLAVIAIGLAFWLGLMAFLGALKIWLWVSELQQEAKRRREDEIHEIETQLRRETAQQQWKARKK